MFGPCSRCAAAFTGPLSALRDNPPWPPGHRAPRMGPSSHPRRSLPAHLRVQGIRSPRPHTCRALAVIHPASRSLAWGPHSHVRSAGLGPLMPPAFLPSRRGWGRTRGLTYSHPWGPSSCPEKGGQATLLGAEWSLGLPAASLLSACAEPAGSQPAPPTCRGQGPSFSDTLPPSASEPHPIHSQAHTLVC